MEVVERLVVMAVAVLEFPGGEAFHMLLPGETCASALLSAGPAFLPVHGGPGGKPPSFHNHGNSGKYVRVFVLAVAIVNHTA